MKSAAMTEWWTYTLSDFLLFSPQTYLRLIELYQRDVWPLQIPMVALGAVAGRLPGGLVATSGWLFVAGTVLFSGSLYAMSLTGHRWLGAVTPLGGLAFLAGWAALAWAAWSR